MQDALLAAAGDWPRVGVPAKVGGWLFQVAVPDGTLALCSPAAKHRQRERHSDVKRGMGCEPGPSRATKAPALGPSAMRPCADGTDQALDVGVGDVGGGMEVGAGLATRRRESAVDPSTQRPW